jgi:hypothetical protein
MGPISRFQRSSGRSRAFPGLNDALYKMPDRLGPQILPTNEPLPCVEEPPPEETVIGNQGHDPGGSSSAVADYPG